MNRWSLIRETNLLSLLELGEVRGRASWNTNLQIEEKAEEEVTYLAGVPSAGGERGRSRVGEEEGAARVGKDALAVCACAASKKCPVMLKSLP